MNLGLRTPSPFVSFVPSFVPLVVQFWVPLRLCGETRRRRQAATHNVGHRRRYNGEPGLGAACLRNAYGSRHGGGAPGSAATMPPNRTK